MNILFINKDDNRGGAAGVAWNLAKELRLLGHQVRFIVRRKFSDEKNVFELKENLVFGKLRQLFHRDFTVVFTNWRDQVLANDIDFGESIQILNHPWLNWADIVHCHNLHGNYFRLDNLINISARRPLVWTLHDLWAATSHCAYPMDNSLRLNRYQKLLWNNTSYLLYKKIEIYGQSNFTLTVPSRWMAKQISGSILKEKQLEVIPNGIDYNIYKKLNQKTKIKQKYNVPLDCPVVAYFPYGKKNFDKGWQYVSDLIAKRSDLYFLRIENIYDRQVLVDHYNAADCLLFPSLAESFGMVPLEALACGLPVVAFPVGAVPEFVHHHKNGYIARYADAQDLEAGMDYILNNIKHIDKVDNKFNIKSVAQKYSALYEKTK